MERPSQLVYEATFISLRPGYEVGLDAQPFVAMVEVENRINWYPVENANLFKSGDKVLVTEIEHSAEQQAKPHIQYRISLSSA